MILQFGLFTRTLLGGAVCLATVGCGGCPAVGCINGFRVVLSAPTQGAYKIEVLHDGALVAGSPAECNIGPTCNNAFFATTVREGLTVRVTTASGVRSTDLAPITYEKRANGDCESCLYASVTVGAP